MSKKLNIKWERESSNMDRSFCWKCHASYHERVFFKSICDSCGAYLHSCMGCQHHQIGKPNECSIPNTDQIRDRGGLNYCDDFKAISEVSKEEGPSVEDIAKRLFKD